MKRYTYFIVLAVSMLILTTGCSVTDKGPKTARTLEQYESKFGELVTTFAEGTSTYDSAVDYYNLNKEKYESEKVDADYIKLEELNQSKAYFLEAEALKNNSENVKAFETYLKVSEDDIENYENAQEAINTILDEVITDVVTEADKLAQGYFYDEAIELMNTIQSPFDSDERVVASKDKYNKLKEELVPYEGPVSHVFFHSLIADKSKAFDGDYMENGYNYWMTTIPEFNKMMESMYERGYILVDIHSFAEKTVDENGKTRFTPIKPLLPKDKKPFVVSIDDVNYYTYMKKDGFADRLVLDEDGNVACALKTEDGEIIARDYDVVPLLDIFVEKHPDFSYRGAKGILAVTGYEGIIGYRTDLLDSPTYAEDVEQAKAVINRLKETGWLFASHGYGHRHTKQISFELLKNDTEKWEREVMSLTGPTDVYIYPYGEEVMPGEEKFAYLQEKGFNIFCGVWSKPFIKVYDDAIRMTRRNLDGFTLHFKPSVLEDLMDPYEVYDKDRPAFK